MDAFMTQMLREMAELKAAVAAGTATELVAKALAEAGIGGPGPPVAVSDNSVNSVNNTLNFSVVMAPLRPFGQEDLTTYHRDIHRTVCASARDGMSIMSNLIGSRWNNPRTPWNSNVAIPNKAEGIPRVFNGETWEPKSKEELYPEMAAIVIQDAYENQPPSDSEYFARYGPQLRTLFTEEDRMRAGETLAKATARIAYPQVLAATERIRGITRTHPRTPLPTAVPVPEGAAPPPPV